jgi:hypothetical protein
MTFPFHGCNNKRRLGRWCLGLLLILAMGLPGCKNWGKHDEGLRAEKLSEPARHVRSRMESSKDKESRAADDPWMSEKAQKIARNLD